jgi:hypothetical protein
MLSKKEYVLAAARIVSLALGLLLVCADGSAMSVRDKKIHDLAWPIQGSEVRYASITDFTMFADYVVYQPFSHGWVGWGTPNLVPHQRATPKRSFSRFFSGIGDLFFERDHPVSWTGVKLIAVDCNYLHYFFSVWLPKIKSPFILITGGDDGVPTKALSRRTDNLIQMLSARKLDLQRILDNPNMIAWYAENYDGAMKHDKIRRYPIGPMIQSKKAMNDLDEIVSKMPDTKNRKLRVYSDLHLNNTSEKNGYGLPTRFQIHEKIKHNPHFDFQRGTMKQAAQFKKRTEYIFSLSLVGAGFDCHRTWESLILGNIVLLQSSPLDPLFEGLPVVIIKDWSEINEANLKKWAAQYHDAFTNPKYREKLTSAFWLKMLEVDIQAGEKKFNTYRPSYAEPLPE